MAVTPFTAFGREVVLGRTVTGTFLLSAATSCPEVFVCLAALRLGQTNMAVANLLGSNMVNMCFLPLMHAASRDTAFYTRIDTLSITILMSAAMLMTGLLMLGLLVRSRHRIFRLSWATLSMLAVYIVGALLVLRLGVQL
jgi:cation:H+ antiporter